jgi:hypothetical protein
MEYGHLVTWARLDVDFRANWSYLTDVVQVHSGEGISTTANGNTDGTGAASTYQYCIYADQISYVERPEVAIWRANV